MTEGSRLPTSLVAIRASSQSAGCQRELCKRLRLDRNSQRGTTILESAVMISVLLVMMFGVIGFGNALYTYHFVSNTAREATRWASVRGSTCTGGLAGGCPANDADVN